MRKIISIFIVMVIIMVGCNQPKPVNHMPKSLPSDFEFVIHYGVGGKNAVNTFNHTVTKDLITAGTATIEDFSFTKEERNKIYRKMREANVMADQNLDNKKGCIQTPYKTYKMKVLINGKTQRFHWSNRNCGMTEDGKKLVAVISFINNIVVEKQAYQQLPEPQGGYE